MPEQKEGQLELKECVRATSLKEKHFYGVKYTVCSAPMEVCPARQTTRIPNIVARLLSGFVK
jgi:hypothetical protein